MLAPAPATSPWMTAACAAPPMACHRSTARMAPATAPDPLPRPSVDPEEVEKFSRMVSFEEIEKNYFNGTLPLENSTWWNLTTFRVDSNLLSGTISETICN